MTELEDFRGETRAWLEELQRINHYRLHAGQSLGEYDIEATPDKQFERYDANLISDPIDWYREASPWGEVVAAPCTLIQYLCGGESAD